MPPPLSRTKTSSRLAAWATAAGPDVATPPRLTNGYQPTPLTHDLMKIALPGPRTKNASGIQSDQAVEKDLNHSWLSTAVPKRSISPVPWR